ncbi:MAG: ABC transporter substrate-binding protein [Treponema sp.]|nr:ABC transporter substrate-binding protein [Treponema sp.]MCL2138326.1 ABC transporter substrate-binding protein [Treponema sp.]
MKKILIIAGIILVALSACSKKEEAGDGEIALTVWSFTEELDGIINNYYTPAHPDVTIKYSMTTTDQFTSKLDPVLVSGQGTPDIFALEAAFVRKYIESGLLLDLTDIYEANKEKIMAYPAEVGSYNGRVYGMSWQACPGAMFYRRSLAQKYLGSDDPEYVQSYFANFNAFLGTAELLKERSGGACVVVSSHADLFQPFLGSRNEPWVVNDKLFIDPVMEAYLDISKTLYDKRWDGQVGQWSEGWYAGMRGELKDEAGKALEVFSYFLPTWGLHYVLKTNAPQTAGDWAMIPGPAPYRWGGTWIAAWKNTKNPDAAKEFIRYLTTDDDFLERYALDSGDLMNNLNVVEKIKDNYAEPFLAGQNHYAEFAEMAKSVDGKLAQGTDQAIEGIFQEEVNAYRFGEKTKAQALGDFKNQAEIQLGL